MKKKNIIVTIVLLVLLVLLTAVHKNDLFSLLHDYSKGTSQETNPEIASLEEQLDQKDRQGITDEEMFHQYHDAVKKRMEEKETKYNAEILEQLNNFAKLYQRDKDSHSYTTEQKMAKRDGLVTYTLKNAFVTKDRSQLNLSAKYDEFKENPGYLKSDGSLKDGYEYLQCDFDIENTGTDTIGVFMAYANDMSLLFFDDDGELYWNGDMTEYVSYQPGENKKHAFYQYDFAPGQVLQVSYITVIPVMAVEQYHTCIVVNQIGDQSFPLDESSLMDISSVIVNKS